MLMLFVLGSAGAAPEPSGPNHTIEVKVVTEFPPVALRHDLSAGEIQKLSGRKKAVGWTRMVVDAWSRLDATVESIDGGETRFWVSGVEVRLGYRSVEMFVAREHPEGSCMYSAILEHEREHVRVDRALVETFAVKIEAAALKAGLPTAEAPLLGVDEEEGMKQARAGFDRMVAPLLAELDKGLRKASQVLDSSRAAKELGKNCQEKEGRRRG